MARKFLSFNKMNKTNEQNEHFVKFVQRGEKNQKHTIYSRARVRGELILIYYSRSEGINISEY